VAFLTEAELNAGFLISRPGNDAVQHHFLGWDPDNDRIARLEQHADSTDATAAMADIFDNAGDISRLGMDQSRPMTIQSVSPPLFANPDSGIAQASNQLRHFPL